MKWTPRLENTPMKDLTLTELKQVLALWRTETPIPACSVNFVKQIKKVEK